MNIRKGEIWEVAHGNDCKLALVLAYRGSYCTVLLLNDEPKEQRDIKLNARGMKYTESGMISYKFTDAFIDFVRKTTDKEFEDIISKVALSLDLPCLGDSIGTMQKKDYETQIECLKHEIEKLNEEKEEWGKQTVFPPDSEEVVRLKAQIEVLEKQNEKLLDRLIG